MLAEVGHSVPPFALRDQYDRNATPLEDDVMGDPVLLVFDRNPASAGPENTRDLLRAIAALHDRLNGTVVTTFVITRRAKSASAEIALAENVPFHVLSDEDGAVFQAFGIATIAPGANAAADPASILLDPNGRAVRICEGLTVADQAEGMFASLVALNEQRPRGLLGMHPPVLVVPNAMDLALCQRLIETWHRPVPLREGDGKVVAGVGRDDGDFKVWNPEYGNVVQYVVRDQILSQEIDEQMMRRIVPQMEKAFGYCPTRREEFRIACYDSAEGGNLAAHRDNPTEPTKHRRFTVSVNLNSRSYEGGELAFRESSDHLYDVPEGTAIVWSCALLHEVRPVTAGRRFILGNHLFG